MLKKFFKRCLNVVQTAINGLVNVICTALDAMEKVVTSTRFVTAVCLFMCASMVIYAQSSSAGDYSAGTSALGTVSTEIAKYVPVVVKLCYAIAGVVAVVGAISVYINITSQLTMPFR